MSVPQSIELYADACAYLARQSLPDFKVFVIEGIAYLQPMNARANQYMIMRNEPNEYELYKPMRMTAEDINLAALWIRENKYRVDMEAI